MKIAYVGSFAPFTDRGSPWTTESVWSKSLELLGHEVIRLEEQTSSWGQRVMVAEGCDLFLWTSTWGYAMGSRREASASIDYLNERMPTASLHLDRWWGLSSREDQIRANPMFRTGWVFTPDGDHDHRWLAEGIHHRWLPPGVYGPECVPGVPRDEWRSDVGFIGNWSDYGHPEHWPHRKSMLDALRARFGGRLGLWPREGEPGPFGCDYNDLLSSIRVVVGDGWQGAQRYWSNRVFEVVGRGGFCVHPAVPGLVEMLPEGFGVSYFPPGDWDAMCQLVEWAVADDDGRAVAVKRGQAFVREHHSYERRMADMLEVMRADGAWA